MEQGKSSEQALPTRPARAWLVASLALCATALPVEAADTTPVTLECGNRCVLVEATTAQNETISETVVLTGSIAPKFQSDISFRVNGRIVQRLVDIGEHISADQVLARLDPQEQTSALDTARAGLASVEALLTQAKIAFERQDYLFKGGFATRPAFDSAQQQLKTQQAAVDSARAAVGQAEEQLGYTDLKAGVSGIVTSRNAETGQVLQAGQTIFTVAQDGPRDAVFNVYEALLEQPSGERTVRVHLQSDQNVATVGRVREVSPSIDASSGTVKVKIGLDSAPKEMSLGAAVVGSGDFRPQSGIVLPRGALFRWDNAPAVWALDATTRIVTPKVVKIARYSGDRIILSGGIDVGDQIVTAGIQFLHPGQKVGIAPAQTK